MVLNDIAGIILTGFAGALVVQLIAFAYARHLGRVDFVDAAWGLSFIAVVAALQLSNPSTNPLTLIVEALVLVWGFRLFWHIYRRFRRSSKQDERYTALMSRWPNNYRGLQTFTKIFLVQALLATTISLPVILIHFYKPDMTTVAAIGLAIWVFGFVCEVVADRQLKQFLQKPHGELMTSGLWRYSRHPNYFGEVTMWWGIALIACTTPLWWLGLVGAATITVLICFVSGLPPAEARASTKKGWREHKAKTSPLILWSPKK